MRCDAIRYGAMRAKCLVQHEVALLPIDKRHQIFMIISFSQRWMAQRNGGRFLLYVCNVSSCTFEYGELSSHVLLACPEVAYLYILIRYGKSSREIDAENMGKYRDWK